LLLFDDVRIVGQTIPTQDTGALRVAAQARKTEQGPERKKKHADAVKPRRRAGP